MTYSDTGFEITLNGNTLSFSGKLERSDYTDIDAFFRKAEQAMSEGSCVIDLTSMSFLNSSGIRSLATFILGSGHSCDIHIDSTVTWQAESIPALANLKPGIQVVKA